MVKQLAVNGEHVVSLTVVARDPVAVDLRDTIWATRIKRGVFILWRRACTEHLTGARLIKTNTGINAPNRFKHVDGAHARCFGGIDRLIEAHTYM
ncbi:unannotated protein [freshwater metagenome]|uniref:Unannotated protein n=1 Tax=freshwater metagenome TaxID=449393 RepID=A0A6J7P8C3_9ZZZZ